MPTNQTFEINFKKQEKYAKLHKIEETHIIKY